MAVWTPLDIADQQFKTSATYDTTTNAIWIKFLGSAAATISIEVNINYECIPRNSVDAFNMVMSEPSNPAPVASIVKTLTKGEPIMEYLNSTPRKS